MITKRIHEIAILNRKTISSKNVPKSIYYLDTGNIIKNKINELKFIELYIEKYPSRAQRIVQDKTIIYSTVRPNQEHYGFLENPLINLIVSTGFTTLDVIDKDIEPKYLYYLLTQKKVTNYLHMIGQNSVSSYPSINPSDLGFLKFKFPEKLIQQKITNVLSSIDSKIELNNKINKELESIAKILYDYWFVQFDFPNENGKPYKSSGGKMIYNQELKREIPHGWEHGTLSDISDLVRGVSYDKNDIKNADDKDVIPILRATNITGNIIDLDDMVYVSKANVSQKQLIKKFEILMTMSSGSKEHIGKNAFFYYDKEISFGAFCAKLVPKKDFEFYLYSYTQSNFMFDTIKNECLGTNINNLNSSLVNGFKIVIPNKNQIEKFNKIVNSIYKKIANIQEQNQELSKLRDWLLPMLMNGQVRIAI